MVGFFDEPKVGAVTVPVLARNKNNFIEKLQALEYIAISFGRKLLEYVDSIYVTPGPLALYRREALIGIGGFDESNLTQDIEATWNITSRGWDRKMALSTYVTSQVPDKFWVWWKQRRRWNIGGLQCIWKYRKTLGRGSMLGYFIIPFFVISLFLGLIGLMIFLYLLFTNIISKFLYTKYSIVAGTPIVTMQDFYITPSFLNYLGVIMFFLGLAYLILILYTLREKIFVKENILNIPFYLVVYLMVYPLVLVDSIYHLWFGSKKWR
jgi:cellulose synthase/poly-beta-1,6-N-acetylglucosamine synthase-like glycosyltransferase